MGKSDNFFIREKIGHIPHSIMYSAFAVFAVVLLLLAYLLFFFRFENEYTGQCTFNAVANEAAFSNIPERLIKKIEIGDTIEIMGNENKRNISLKITNVYARENRITASYISPNNEEMNAKTPFLQGDSPKVNVVLKKVNTRLIHQILSR
jgi:hypothetical protein